MGSPLSTQNSDAREVTLKAKLGKFTYIVIKQEQGNDEEDVEVAA